MFLPIELIKIIASYSDLNTLFNFVKTNKYLFYQLQPYIFYNNVVNHNKNIKHFDINLIRQIKNINTIYVRHPVLVFKTLPHCGQDVAFELTSLPHSLHFFSDIYSRSPL